MSGKGVELGAGYISLTVKKAGNGLKDIEAEVEGVGKTADKVGKQAGQALNEGITKGAKGAGKSVGDAIVESATKAGKDAGKAAGDALKDGIEKSAKGTKVTLPKVDTQPARDSIIRDIGGGIIEAARQGAKDAGVDLDKWAVEQAGKLGKTIGDAIGNSPIGDWTRSLGINADQAADAIGGLGTAIVGVKQKDLAGTLNGISQALTGIGQNDAADIFSTIGNAAGTAQKQFSTLADGISAGGKALGVFSGNTNGIAGKIGGIGAAAAAAAPEVAALTAAILAAEQEGDKLNKQHFHNRQVFPSEGIPGSAQWFWNKGKRLVNGEPLGDVLTTGPGGPDAGGDQPAPTPGPGSPVQGPYTVAPAMPDGPVNYSKLYGSGVTPQALPPTTPRGGAVEAAPSAVVKQQSGSPLAAALAANGSFSPEQIRLIQGFSKVEGNNPAGNPTLGFTDSQLGGDASLQGHVNALAQQFRNRAPVAGPFPAGGSDQQQAAWIAAVVGQNGSPSDWQGNAQPPAAVYQQRIINSLPPIGFDDGGILPPGMTLTNNASGQPEIVLTQDQAKNAMQGMPGMGAGPSDTPPSSGMSPGANGPAALTDLLGGQQPDGSPLGAMGAPGGKDLRTQGYIPAGAGGGGQAGTSLWSGSLQLGAQAINGLIEQAGSAAATAISAAATAGSFGAGGQAAGPASSFLIGIGTKMAERGVSYGFQLAGIAGDALAESLMPFGVPRLFQTSPQQFMPQLPGKPAATTTGEKAQQKQDNPAAANQPGMDPGGPVQPGQMPGQQVIGPPAPIATAGTGNFKPEAPPVGPALSGGAGAPSLAPTQPVTPPVPQSGPMATPSPQPQSIPPNTQPIQPTDLGGLLGVFDTGGWLMPGGLAANMTNRPEPILNDEQWGNLQAIAAQGMPMPDPKAISGGGNDYSVNMSGFTVTDVNQLMKEASSQQRLQIMRHAGRP
ncbi:bacteriophage-like membrane protein [Mycobacterium intracellulare subsp. chimaera]|uniref:hypothetical protein n=1 Tax=Mycobacterium intracellulare TaxID=1767 RepID=UPI00093E4B46|nr:hypothetical protein [Mycobacterium intracellulare]ASL08455.1 bacteriophage-like membrane protein [Mycobacterium intracellulare subsp. chimaera]MCV7324268.1 hypothetical protein [Mycobacterium intracellulare subsp. chimaera]ORV19983.1 hypothetical protein AWB97_24875 [Mycobacterium intracellulare subsp. chimaera]